MPLALALLTLLSGMALGQDYPDPAFRDAEQALVAGDLERARKALEKGLRKVPDHANAWADLGNVHLIQQRPEPARQAFEKALGADPGHYVAMNGLGAAYLQSGEREQAIEWFLRSFETNKDYATPLLNLGDVSMLLGRLEEAIVYYDSAHQIAPGNKRATVALVDIHIAADVPQQAERYVLAALSRAPRDIDLLVSAGTLYQAMDQDPRALDHLATAKEIDPTRYDVHRTAGLSFLKLNMWPEAESAYRAALEKYSEDFQVHFELAQVYGLSGAAMERAMEHLGYVLQLNPGFYPAMAFRGDLLEEMGQIAAAVEAWEQVLEVAPRHAPTLNSLGRRHMVEGRYAQAISLFNDCLAADPAFHAARLNRGATYAMKGNCDAARPDLEAIVRVGGGLGAQAEQLLAQCR